MAFFDVERLSTRVTFISGRMSEDDIVKLKSDTKRGNSSPLYRTVIFEFSSRLSRILGFSSKKIRLKVIEKLNFSVLLSRMC